jgi:hypothetical protein
MTLPLSDITQKRLVLVKQLFQTASVQSTARYSAVSRIMAVIGFDLAVETALKVVVSTLDTREQPDKIFNALLQQVNSKLQKAGYMPLGDLANIRHVHSIRNDAQHKAKYPTESDVIDCRIYVRDFLQELTRQLWGISFDGICLADLVQNQKARELFSRGEAALTNGDYRETVRLANAGLAWVTSRVRRMLFWRRADLTEGFDFSGHEDVIDEVIAEAIEDAFEPVRDEVSEELGALGEAVLCVALGMNYPGFVRLNLIIPERVGFNTDGNPIYQPQLFERTVDEGDAGFALRYCIDAVIQIEAQIGNVEKPQPSI